MSDSQTDMNNAWRWGDARRQIDRETLQPALGWLSQQLQAPLTLQPPLPVNGVRPSRLNREAIRGVQAMADGAGVTTTEGERVAHTGGKSYPDVLSLRQGYCDNPPDAVIYPENEQHVAAVLAWAARMGYAVCPYGGGTSVVGGLSPQTDRPWVTLDLRRLEKLARIDFVSQTATFEAGIRGPALEAALDKYGLTLGHFPQSFESSTLGGWIATRSAGQESGRYGRIEDLIVAVRVVSANGVLQTLATPASAAGPSLMRMHCGSEGRFGVIVNATVRTHGAPAARRHMAYLFPSWSAGLEALRAVAQSDAPPTVFRLSDEMETVMSQALSRSPDPRGLHRMARSAGLIWLARRHGLDPQHAAAAIVVAAGSQRAAGEQMHATAQASTRAGGAAIGGGPARRWEEQRFQLPYVRDVLMDHGVMVDTLETATEWSNVETLYAAVRGAIQRTAEQRGLAALVGCHVSHCYRDGASLYFTFLTAPKPGSELGVWQAIKTAANKAIRHGGGTMTHHHGVGQLHQRGYLEEAGEVGLQAIRGAALALDPQRVLNPGILFPDSGPAAPRQPVRKPDAAAVAPPSDVQA